MNAISAVQSQLLDAGLAMRSRKRPTTPPSSKLLTPRQSSESVQESANGKSQNLTLGNVFWPEESQNFSALPGVGGMYVKGFGLIRGPPSAVGIPIYYFHPLQPPPFESGVYSGTITFIEGAIDRPYGDGYGPRGSYGEGDTTNNEPSKQSRTAPRKPPDDGPSTPWIPLSKREKTAPKPPPPPKAGGWQQVLEELAKKSKGGLKKVEEKEERKVGKLKTGKKKPGEFVDIMDELKHRLAKLQGTAEDADDEEDITPVPKPKSIPKPAAKTFEASPGPEAKPKEVTFADTKPNGQTANAPESFAPIVQTEPKTSTDTPSSVAKTPTQLNNIASKQVSPQPARPQPTYVPLPPPLPASWPPKPYIADDIPAPLPQNLVTENTNHPRMLAPIVTDLPYSPSGTNIDTSTATATSIVVNPPGKFLIPVSNLPVGLHTSQRPSSIPLPSGYYIPAPRLDMVEPGNYEFGGLTTQRQIDAINKLIRTAIHYHEKNESEPSLTPKENGNISALTSPIISTSKTPRARERISSPLPTFAPEAIMTPNILYQSPRPSLPPTTPKVKYVDRLSLSAELSSADIESQFSTDSDSGSDTDEETDLFGTSNDAQKYSRSVDGHIVTHVHQAAPVRVHSNLQLPSGFHSNVQRIRRAHKLKVEHIEDMKSLELRRYDNEDLAEEIRRSLPTSQQSEKSLTVPKGFVSAVDQRLQTKTISFRKPIERSADDKLPLCSFIDKVYTADTALNNGYDDISKAFWTSSLRKPIEINGEYRASDVLSASSLGTPKAPSFSDVLERRREKTRLKLLKETENELTKKQEEKNRKEALRIKAISVAQANGVYSPLLLNSTDKRGIYMQKMIAKYGKNQSGSRGLSHSNLTGLKSSAVHQSSISDNVWKDISRYPNYESARTMHKYLVQQNESVDLNSYMTHSPHKFQSSNKL